MQLPEPHIPKETPHKGELRLTSEGYPSGMKITEEENGSSPYCLQLPQVIPRQAGPGVDLQQSYSRGA